jgi:hypothetical protein
MKDIEYEFGPWIDHDLSGCPLQDGETAEIEWMCARCDERHGQVVVIGTTFPRAAWNQMDFEARVLRLLTGAHVGIERYRVRRAKISQLLETDVETPVLEDA